MIRVQVNGFCVYESAVPLQVGDEVQVREHDGSLSHGTVTALGDQGYHGECLPVVRYRTWTDVENQPAAAGDA